MAPRTGLVAPAKTSSETSLIQTFGPAARNVDGRVILYADQVTAPMDRALAETSRRREKQMACTGYSCTGTTPARLVGTMTLSQFLLFGREPNLTRAPEAGGGSLKSPGSFATKPPAQSTEPAPTDGTLY